MWIGLKNCNYCWLGYVQDLQYLRYLGPKLYHTKNVPEIHLQHFNDYYNDDDDDDDMDLAIHTCRQNARGFFF